MLFFLLKMGMESFNCYSAAVPSVAVGRAASFVFSEPNENTVDSLSLMESTESLRKKLELAAESVASSPNKIKMELFIEDMHYC